MVPYSGYYWSSVCCHKCEYEYFAPFDQNCGDIIIQNHMISEISKLNQIIIVMTEGYFLFSLLLVSCIVDTNTLLTYSSLQTLHCSWFYFITGDRSDQ